MINWQTSWWRILTSVTSTTAALAFLVVGCAEGEYANRGKNYETVADSDGTASIATLGDDLQTMPGSSSRDSRQPSERRLIYSASVSIEILEFEQFTQQLQDRLQMLGGFISNYQDLRRTGMKRSGKWIVRVDADKFHDLVGWLDETASVVGKQVNSQDVTEEFVDLNARLANKRSTESRLINLLDDRTGSLEDVLVVERELDRVREEIERMEGRLRLLSDRIALSTIEITANTRIEYQSQKIALGQRIQEGWQMSFIDLRRTFETALVVFVRLMPWLLTFGILFIVTNLGYQAVRKLLKSRV